jgi:hypothetical protein
MQATRDKQANANENLGPKGKQRIEPVVAIP